jgi:hypothetical protein
VKLSSYGLSSVAGLTRPECTGAHGLPTSGGRRERPSNGSLTASAFARSSCAGASNLGRCRAIRGPYRSRDRFLLRGGPGIVHHFDLSASASHRTPNAALSRQCRGGRGNVSSTSYVLRKGGCLRCESQLPEQVRQRLADGLINVDDGHERVCADCAGAKGLLGSFGHDAQDAPVGSLTP